MKLPSFHDDYLVRYEVDCEGHRIVFFIKDHQNARLSSIVFSAVEGYQLVDDAFGNIILDIERVPASYVLTNFKSQIAESHRMSGAPGPWAADLDAAAIYFDAQDVQGFVLSSSYGLSGWILAKQAEVQQTIPADRVNTKRAMPLS